MKQILQTLTWIFFMPVLHLLITALFVLYHDGTWQAILIRFLYDSLYLGSLPLIWLNVPLSTKFTTFSLMQLLVLVDVILIWAIVGRLCAVATQRNRKLPLIFLASVGIVYMGAMLWILRPPPTEATIHIDLSQTLGVMPNYRGFSQGGEGQMLQAGYFESAMQKIQELEPRYIRIDHIYDYYNVYQLHNDQIVYDWSELDRIVDAIVASGAEPYISLSYTPQLLAVDTVYRQPTDLSAWAELVYQTVYHYNVERDLDITYWEIWNEPNLAHFWIDTPHDFYELYAVTARAIKRADADAKVGGIALLSSDVPALGWSAAYLLSTGQWIDGWLNYTTVNDVPIDFVSWHFYHHNPRYYAWNVALYERWTSRIQPRPELILSEWNWTVGKTSGYDTGATNAYIASVLQVLSDSPLTQALYFEPIDGTVEPQGSWGLLYATAESKPSYAAWLLLSQLEGQRLAVETNHPHVSALATIEGDTVSIIVWHYGGDLSSIPVNLHISSVDADDVMVSQQSITATDSFNLVTSASNQINWTFDLEQGDIRLFEFQTKN